MECGHLYSFSAHTMIEERGTIKEIGQRDRNTRPVSLLRSWWPTTTGFHFGSCCFLFISKSYLPSSCSCYKDRRVSVSENSKEWQKWKVWSLHHSEMLYQRVSDTFSLLLLLLSCPVLSDSLWPHGLSLTIFWSLPELMFIASVMLFSHLILWRPLLLLPSIFPSIRDYSNELSVRIRWPKYWSFSLTISPSSEYSELISLKIDGLISLLSKGLSGVFSSTTVRRYQFFGILPSLWSSSHNRSWPLVRPQPCIFPQRLPNMFHPKLTPTSSYCHCIFPLAGFSYYWKTCSVPRDHSAQGQELTVSKKERQSKEMKTTWKENILLSRLCLQGPHEGKYNIKNSGC